MSFSDQGFSKVEKLAEIYEKFGIEISSSKVVEIGVQDLTLHKSGDGRSFKGHLRVQG